MCPARTSPCSNAVLRLSSAGQIPDKHIWLRGDNAARSKDSRHYGALCVRACVCARARVCVCVCVCVRVLWHVCVLFAPPHALRSTHLSGVQCRVTAAWNHQRTRYMQGVFPARVCGDLLGMPRIKTHRSHSFSRACVGFSQVCACVGIDMANAHRSAAEASDTANQ